MQNADPLDFQTIADQSAPYTFSLTAANAPSLPSDAYTAIELSLIPYAEADVPASFLLLDCTTGKGIACNIDEIIYGASSFKALYCSYVCQAFVETGLYALDDYIPSYAQDDYESYWIDGYDTLEDLMFNSIVYSSNGAFGSLRDTFDGDIFDAWLAEQGIDASIFGDEWFPYLTVRDAAALWMDTYQYLDTQSETAVWLDDLLANTEVSFIRDTLEENEEVIIIDKAGWYADDGWSNYNSVCDSGIVKMGGRDYLLSIMTGAAWSDESVEDFHRLADAVLSARGILA